MEVSDQLLSPAAFTLGEKAPANHYIRGWMDPRAGKTNPDCLSNAIRGFDIRLIFMGKL
jgi:hypothetical protein